MWIFFQGKKSDNPCNTWKESQYKTRAAKKIIKTGKRSRKRQRYIALRPGPGPVKGPELALWPKQ